MPDSVSLEDLHELANTIAKPLHRLGTNDAATSMGAIELLGKTLEDGLPRTGDALSEPLSRLADAVDTHAAAISEGTQRIADALHSGLIAIANRGGPQ